MPAAKTLANTGAPLPANSPDEIMKRLYARNPFVLNRNDLGRIFAEAQERAEAREGGAANAVCYILRTREPHAQGRCLPLAVCVVAPAEFLPQLPGNSIRGCLRKIRLDCLAYFLSRRALHYGIHQRGSWLHRLRRRRASGYRHGDGFDRRSVPQGRRPDGHALAP